MDEAVGHYRRYELKEIKIKCENAYLKLKEFNMLIV